MNFISEIFLSSNVAFEWNNYAMSYLELIGCIAGMICVIFAIQSNILTWIAACINIFCFCILFFQVQLYADMLLQIFFLIFSIYGWIKWNKKQKQIQPIRIETKKLLRYVFAMISIGFFLYFLITNLHILLPNIFNNPATYAVIDSIIASMSIIATIMMANREIENWILWIIINVFSVFLYFKKSVYLISIEYFVFTILGFVGFFRWRKEMNIH